MILKLGTIISATVLLVLVPPAIGKNSCATLSDLAEPCGCPFTKESFEPICGSDGQTYLNACFLHCKEILEETSIRVQHKGTCSRDSLCTCNAGYSPVCGSNGVTYSNECVLNCNIKKDSSLFLKSRGKCSGFASHEETRFRSLRAVRKCNCNPADGPICASNGVTYANYCVMRCKTYQDRAVSFLHWGECQKPSDEMLTDEYWLSMKDNRTPEKKCSCGTITYYTRCGGNVKLYRPLCECDARNYAVPVKTRDPCDDIYQLKNNPRLPQGDPKTCYCAAVNRPVCGNDDETYANICVLHCNSKKNPSLAFVRWGSCGNIRLVSRLKKRPSRDEEESFDVSSLPTNY